MPTSILSLKQFTFNTQSLEKCSQPYKVQVQQQLRQAGPNFHVKTKTSPFFLSFTINN